MNATTEQFKAAMLPLYREMIATAMDMQTAASPHRTHLRLALQLLENGTEIWWTTHRDDAMNAALAQTFSVARCDETCFNHPNNAVRTSGIFA